MTVNEAATEYRRARAAYGEARSAVKHAEAEEERLLRALRAAEDQLHRVAMEPPESDSCDTRKGR